MINISTILFIFIRSTLVNYILSFLLLLELWWITYLQFDYSSDQCKFYLDNHGHPGTFVSFIWPILLLLWLSDICFISSILFICINRCFFCELRLYIRALLVIFVNYVSFCDFLKLYLNTPAPLWTVMRKIWKIMLSLWLLWTIVPQSCCFCNFSKTRRYGPLRGPNSSSCGGLQPLAEAYYAVLVFSSNLGNFY